MIDEFSETLIYDYDFAPAGFSDPFDLLSEFGDACVPAFEELLDGSKLPGEIERAASELLEFQLASFFRKEVRAGVSLLDSAGLDAAEQYVELIDTDTFRDCFEEVWVDGEADGVVEPGWTVTTNNTSNLGVSLTAVDVEARVLNDAGNFYTIRHEMMLFVGRGAFGYVTVQTEGTPQAGLAAAELDASAAFFELATAIDHHLPNPGDTVAADSGSGPLNSWNGFTQLTTFDGESPPAPPPLDGYIAAGAVSTEYVQVSASPVAVRAGVGGQSAGAGCEDFYWMVRWQTTGSASLRVAANVAPGIGFRFPLTASDLPAAPDGSAGQARGAGCDMLVFYSTAEVSDAETVIELEVQHYRESVPGSSSVHDDDAPQPPPRPEPPNADSIQCGIYEWEAFELPQKPCTQGAWVQCAQTRLVALGYSLDADSFYGPGTYAAVAAFQSELGLVPDGFIGRQTYLALMRGAPELGDNVEPDPNEPFGFCILD